jgi:hypothetical protein
MTSSHRSARDEHEQIDQQVAKDEERYSAASEHSCSQWDDAHDLCERRIIHLIGNFQGGIGCGRFFSMHDQLRNDL